MTAERDVLAAKYFPQEWALVVNAVGKSKRRQQLRKAAEEARDIEALRANGSACVNCSSYNTRQIHGMKQRGHCEMQSDFHGYAFVKSNAICAKWSKKP